MINDYSKNVLFFKNTFSSKNCKKPVPDIFVLRDVVNAFLVSITIFCAKARLCACCFILKSYTYFSPWGFFFFLFFEQALDCALLNNVVRKRALITTRLPSLQYYHILGLYKCARNLLFFFIIRFNPKQTCATF